jgi:hypothetical protein
MKQVTMNETRLKQNKSGINLSLTEQRKSCPSSMILKWNETKRDLNGAIFLNIWVSLVPCLYTECHSPECRGSLSSFVGKMSNLPQRERRRQSLLHFRINLRTNFIKNFFDVIVLFFVISYTVCDWYTTAVVYCEQGRSPPCVPLLWYPPFHIHKCEARKVISTLAYHTRV